MPSVAQRAARIDPEGLREQSRQVGAFSGQESLPVLEPGLVAFPHPDNGPPAPDLRRAAPASTRGPSRPCWKPGTSARRCWAVWRRRRVPTSSSPRAGNAPRRATRCALVQVDPELSRNEAAEAVLAQPAPAYAPNLPPSQPPPCIGQRQSRPGWFHWMKGGLGAAPSPTRGPTAPRPPPTRRRGSHRRSQRLDRAGRERQPSASPTPVTTQGQKGKGSAIYGTR